jgi:hypothetical protein
MVSPWHTSVFLKVYHVCFLCCRLNHCPPSSGQFASRQSGQHAGGERAIGAYDDTPLAARTKGEGQSQIVAGQGIRKTVAPLHSGYKGRLLAACLVAEQSRGTLEFVIPYLDEYLRGEWDEA